MLSIIGIKKTIKQHTDDMDITDLVDYKISAPPRFYNILTSSVIQSAQKCGSKFFDWSRKITLFYRDLFYAWQRRYLN
jgi:hypothetical protein